MKGSGLKQLTKYLKGYRILLFFTMLAAILGTVFTVLAPAVMGMITTKLFDGAKNGKFDWQSIAGLILLLASLYIVGQIFAFLQSLGMTRVTARVVQKLRDDIDRKMHHLKLNYYDTKSNGEILSTITNDVDTVSSMLSQSVTQIITQVITAAGILIIMFRMNLWLSLIAIAMVPLSLAAALGVMKASSKHYGQQQNLLGEMNGFVEEIYNGKNVIEAFGYEERAQRRFDEINGKLQETAERADTESGTISPITSLVNNAGYVFSAVLGCFFVLSGKMTVGTVQSMLQYTKQFSQPFTSIAGMAGSLGASAAAADRIASLMNAEEEKPDPDGVQNQATDEHDADQQNADRQDIDVNGPAYTSGDPKGSEAGSVQFRHVAFGYSADNPLMTDVSFSVRPGQKIAIVGPTGAGKTTLVNLLMRFYEIEKGEILVDGVNTKKMTRDQLRSHFSMVLQDTWLFEGTVLDNLSYGRDGLTKAKVEEAAEAASADSFIRMLPGSYDFELSHGGENISQGERQLLTIARAMAADPEIMILDEATSNVDTYTEKKIQDAMQKLMKDRTSFVIAHRLSTIRDADMILYMENGDIKEAGSHDQLMARHGKYEQLYNSQFAS